MTAAKARAKERVHDDDTGPKIRDKEVAVGGHEPGCDAPTVLRTSGSVDFSRSCNLAEFRRRSARDADDVEVANHVHRVGVRARPLVTERSGIDAPWSRPVCRGLDQAAPEPTVGDEGLRPEELLPTRIPARDDSVERERLGFPAVARDTEE